MPGMCRGVQERPRVWFLAGMELVGMLVEQRPQRSYVALPRCLEQLSLDAQRIHVRLERAPAREAVLLRELELGVGELRVGVRLPQLLETSLGLLAEPVEVGRVGKRQRSRRVLALFGHETPSFLGESASPLMTPGVRVRGEEVKVM